MARLAGKIAIVTGAARGMGEAEARLFAEEGAMVVVADVLDDEAAEVAASIGEAAVPVHLDVTSEADWERVLAMCQEAFGTPDVLVNNAGILHYAPLLQLDVDDFRRVLEVNTIGPFLGMKVVGGAMVAAHRGSIVNVSSTGGMIGMSMISAYVASKWAVRGMTKAAAIEFGPQGVRVNSLHPGGVATPMAGGANSVSSDPPGSVRSTQTPRWPHSTPATRANRSAASAARSRSPAWPCTWHRTSRRTAPAASSSPTAATSPATTSPPRSPPEVDTRA